MTARKKRARSSRELDLMDLRTRQRLRDERVAHALVTMLCRADAPTLAAVGIILRFVVRWAPRRQQ